MSSIPAGLTIPDEGISRALATLPHDKPIVMTNLARFRPVTTYAPGTTATPTDPIPGKQAYFERYLANFRGVLAAHGVAARPVLFAPAPLTIRGGPQWDIHVLVEFPDLPTFIKLLNSDEYRDNCLGHRLASIEEWQMVWSVAVDMPL